MDNITTYLLSEVSRLSTEVDQLRGLLNSSKRILDFHNQDLNTVQERLFDEEYASKNVTLTTAAEIRRLEDKVERTPI